LFLASFFLAKRYPHAFAEQKAQWTIFSKKCGIVCIAVGLYIMAFSKGI